MDLATWATIATSLGGFFVSVAAFVSMRRMRAAEAFDKEEQAKERAKSRARLEDEITERVLSRANVDNERLSKEVERLRLELQNERAERIKDAQRISALEDELDKSRAENVAKDRIIAELKSNGTFPAVRAELR